MAAQQYINFNPGTGPYTYASGVSYVAAGQIVVGPAVLYNFSGFSSLASLQWILFFDVSAVGNIGSAGPTIVVQVGGAAAAGNIPWNDLGAKGQVFNNGIYWTNSTTAPSVTIGAANCFLRASYNI